MLYKKQAQIWWNLKNISETWTGGTPDERNFFNNEDSQIL